MANHYANEASFCQELLMLGRWHAARRGLNGEDAEDCAVEFTLQMLTRLHSLQAVEVAANLATLTDATWLHRRAHTHTRNFQRAVITHSNRFCPQATTEGVGTERNLGNIEAPLLKAEFWQHIFAALDSLDAVPRQLLIGRQLYQHSIGTLAAACGRSEHAVEQTLVRARQQMRRVLERRGCGAAVLREYVAAFTPSNPPCQMKADTAGKSLQGTCVTPAIIQYLEEEE